MVHRRWNLGCTVGEGKGGNVKDELVGRMRPSHERGTEVRERLREMDQGLGQIQVVSNRKTLTMGLIRHPWFTSSLAIAL